jgi:hypothetical protein
MATAVFEIFKPVVMIARAMLNTTDTLTYGISEHSPSFTARPCEVRAHEILILAACRFLSL